MMRILIICLFTAFLTMPASAQTLFSADFQDGDTVGWKGNPGKGDIRLTSYGKNNSMRLQHNAYALVLIPTNGFADMWVTVDFAAKKLRSKDACILETSFSGDEWTEIGRVIDGQDDAISLHKISGHAFNVSAHKILAVRLRISAGNDKSTCWADNVQVTGIRTTATLLQHIPYGVFTSDAPMITPVSTQAFKKPEDAAPTTQYFQGQLRLNASIKADSFTIVKDQFGFEKTSEKLKYIPSFSIDIISSGDTLIPVQRGPQAGMHPDWEWLFEPGKVWHETGDYGWNRASIPIALQERGANCIHNGLISFLYKEAEVSDAVIQIGSETCAYLQFNLMSKLNIDFAYTEIPNAQNIISAYKNEIHNRLPRLPIQSLKGTDIRDIGSHAEINPSNMTTFGFAVDGKLYASPCTTRFGDDPYCATMPLPSYSMAKSMVAGIGLMRLEKLYPGARTAIIANYVPDCSAKKWQDVSFENALDMATGNYTSAEHDKDEAAPETWKFLGAETHAAKIKYACSAYKRKAKPGSKFVYHTSDTYLLGVAMQNYLREKSGSPKADLYNDLLRPIWQALELGPLSNTTRRTYDASAHTFTGWGLTLHADDFVRTAQFLEESGKIAGTEWLDRSLLNAALQRNPQSRGHQAINKTLKYRAGFWAYNAGPYLGCKKDLWLPHMSGFGGISTVLMPHGQIYYFFSDGYEYGWRQAAKAAHKLNPICEVK